VQSESLNEKYLGLPSDVGRSKQGAFAYLKDRGIEEVARMDGEASLGWW
jgi:hypothetical protein